MPPQVDVKNLGWRAFFALLAFLQIVAIGVMWRTYDSIDGITNVSNRNEIRINEIILPKLLRHDREIEDLKSQ